MRIIERNEALVFVEMPVFERIREQFLTDESYHALQSRILENPEAGVLMQGTGGLRKLRFQDPAAGKGSRGGTRTIYYYWKRGPEIWLFTIYGKTEKADLSVAERNLLRDYLRVLLEMKND